MICLGDVHCAVPVSDLRYQASEWQAKFADVLQGPGGWLAVTYLSTTEGTRPSNVRAVEVRSRSLPTSPTTLKC